MKRFEIVCGIFGKEIGIKLGQWRLQNVPCYGGWVIVEATEYGGESHPFCDLRVSRKEMEHALGMIIQAERIKQQMKAS